MAVWCLGHTGCLPQKNIHLAWEGKQRKEKGVKGNWVLHFKASSKNFKLYRCYFLTPLSEMTEHWINLRWPQTKSRKKDEHLSQPKSSPFLMLKNWAWAACKINFTRLILGVSDFIIPELELLLCITDILQFLFFFLKYPQCKTVRTGRQHICKLEFGQRSGSKTLALSFPPVSNTGYSAL